MQGKTRRTAIGAAALAMLLGTSAHAAAGTYTQSLTVSDLTYTVEDLNLNDGIAATYNIYRHSHGVEAGSALSGQPYQAQQSVTTFRPKPLDAGFDLAGADAAVTNTGHAGGVLSANLGLDMAANGNGGGILARSTVSEELSLAAHSALIITIDYQHQWFYDGELSPVVEGEASQQLLLSATVGLYANGVNSAYNFYTYRNGTGSDAGTVTLRIENRWDRTTTWSFSSAVNVGMSPINIITGPVIEPPLPPVPEPGTIGMLLGGLPLVLLAAGRRRAAARRNAATPVASN